MRRLHYSFSLVLVFALGSIALVSTVNGQRGGSRVSHQTYEVAFASFAPLNTDIVVADADGSNPVAVLPHSDLDCNGSFSPDGEWIVFTSTRNGSADIYRVRLNGSGLARLTDDPAFDDQGALAPDGKSLAFVSSRSGQADVWILELGTGALRNLTRHPAGDFRPSWSPDGQWIAFSSDRESKKPPFSFVTLHSTEIYLIRADGSGLRRVTHLDAFAGSPAWSGDGKRLVYYEASVDDVQKITSPRRLRGTTQVVSIDLATSERRVLTTGEGEKWSPHWLTDGKVGYVSGGPNGGIEFVSGAAGARGEMRSPSWSPDGRRMVFHRDVESQWPPVRAWPSRDSLFRLVRTGILPSYAPDGDRLVANNQTAGNMHNSILVMDADGSRRSILFSDAERSALAPAWSPRGDRIAFGIGGFFQNSTTMTADIAVMRPDGTDVQILTDGTGNYGLPSWSPDGRRLVYRAVGSNGKGLSIVDLETRAVRVLTTGSGHENFPSWSPKGDRIAFTSDRDGDYEIYTIRPDGTDVQRLTRMPGNDAHNAWSPDGQWIAFTSARSGFKDEAPLHPHNPQPYGDLYVMRADGSDVRMLTDDQFEDGTPSWLPTSRAR
jgi:Tol biopolymer transport system component